MLNLSRAVRPMLFLSATVLFFSPTTCLPESAGSAISPSQTPLASIPQWQKSAGSTAEFDVVSVKQDDSQTYKPPSLALTADDHGGLSGNLFTADYPVIDYIEFAYKLWLAPSQRELVVNGLPKWVSTDRYQIQARLSGHPTKDQIRLMMQSLLAARFHLKIRFETKQLPAYALTPIKAGKLGPGLQAHSQRPSCDNYGNYSASKSAKNGSVFPPSCGVYMAELKTNNMYVLAARDTSLDLLAAALPSYGRLDRPVVDRTGVAGYYDVSITWTRGLTLPGPASQDPQSDLPQITFLDALDEQLGFKLVSTIAPINTPIIEHIERPSEN